MVVYAAMEVVAVVAVVALVPIPVHRAVSYTHLTLPTTAIV